VIRELNELRQKSRFTCFLLLFCLLFTTTSSLSLSAESLSSKPQFSEIQEKVDHSESLTSEEFQYLLDLVADPELRDFDLEVLRRTFLKLIPKDTLISPLEEPPREQLVILDALLSIDFRLSLGKEFFDNAEAQKRIRPDAVYKSLRQAISELQLSSSQSASELEKQMVRAFMTMRQRGKFQEFQNVAHGMNMVPQIMEDRGLSEADAKIEAIRIGEQAFLNRVKSGDPELSVKITNFGKAEVNALDERKFIKVVHGESERAILFVDADKIDPNSKHLRKVISRIMIDGGKSRTDGEVGRDVLVVWFRNGNGMGFSGVDRVEKYDRPEEFSEDWWARWWWATAAPVRARDVGLGATFGVAQGLVTLGLAFASSLAMQAWHNWSDGTPAPISEMSQIAWDHLPWLGAKFTVAYGTFIGAFSNSIRVWEMRGTHEGKIIKKFAKSAGYSYPWTAIGTSDPLVFGQASAVAQTHARILLNFYLNGVGKVYWQRITEVLEATRKSSREVYMPVLSKIPGVGPKFFVWSGGSFTYQAVELGTAYPPKMLDLGNFFKFHIDAINYDLPLGKIMFVASIPLAVYSSMRVAEKANYEGASKMREDWQRMKKTMRVITFGPFVVIGNFARWASPWSRNRELEDKVDSYLEAAANLPANVVKGSKSKWQNGVKPFLTKSWQASWSLTKLATKYSWRGAKRAAVVTKNSCARALLELPSSRDEGTFRPPPF